MKLYIPGQGNVDINAFKINNAVKTYDERLFFARNENTGDWCVYVTMPRPEAPYPVIGFGNEIPSIDTVMSRVSRADTMRVGWQIFDEIQKSQEDYKKQFVYAADQASEESAEVVEHFLRKHNKSPVVKVFMNKEVTTDDA